MNFECFMATKHLIKGKRHGFLSLISIISVLGVSVGVMALIVVLAVMSGFDRELKSKIVGVHPHLVVEKIGGIENASEIHQKIESLKLDQIISIAPFVQGQGLIRTDSAAVGISVKGIDPAHEGLDLFAKHMQEGTLQFEDVLLPGKQAKVKSISRIVIGEELARDLNVLLGDVVTLIAPALEEDPVQAVKRARSTAFVVSGIFRVGMSNFDSSFALIGMAQAQELYRIKSHVSGVSLRLKNVEEADSLKEPLHKLLGPGFSVRSWMDLNRTFFSALKVEKTVMTILLSLITLVAAFNIVSTLTMIIMEKTKDIGILRALGATQGAIRSIFLIQGFVVGAFGIMIGAASGLVLAFHLNQVSDFLERNFGISVFPSDIYYFDQIPTQINSSDVFVITALALLLSLLAGLYPADRAARLDPVQALRYE